MPDIQQPGIRKPNLPQVGKPTPGMQKRNFPQRQPTPVGRRTPPIYGGGGSNTGGTRKQFPVGPNTGGGLSPAQNKYREIAKRRLIQMQQKQKFAANQKRGVGASKQIPEQNR